MDNRKKIKEVYDSIVCKVDVSRGAPTGRPGVGSMLVEEGTQQTIYRRRVPLVYDGAYDKGGAYWGCGKPLYVEFTLDKSYVHFFRE